MAQFISRGVTTPVTNRSAGNAVFGEGTAGNGVWAAFKPDGVGDNGVCFIRCNSGTLGVSAESDGTPAMLIGSGVSIYVYTDGPVYIAGAGGAAGYGGYYS